VVGELGFECLQARRLRLRQCRCLRLRQCRCLCLCCGPRGKLRDRRGHEGAMKKFVCEAQKCPVTDPATFDEQGVGQKAVKRGHNARVAREEVTADLEHRTRFPGAIGHGGPEGTLVAQEEADLLREGRALVVMKNEFGRHGRCLSPSRYTGRIKSLG